MVLLTIGMGPSIRTHSLGDCCEWLTQKFHPPKWPALLNALDTTSVAFNNGLRRRRP